MTFQISDDATATPSPPPILTATPTTAPFATTAYLPLIFSQETRAGSNEAPVSDLSDFRADQVEAVQADRTFYLYMQFGQWMINGRTLPRP